MINSAWKLETELPAKGCRSLRVIAMARGEATMPSSRGEMRGAST
ncbi:hypothetical protein ABZV14_40630 [Streptosporangium canum]